MKGTLQAALHNEFSKYVRQKFPYLGMLAVGLLAGFWPTGMHEMADSGGETNGFSLLLKGAVSAVTSIIPLFAAIFATVLVASETDTGTYRNVLSRPIRRSTFLTAKILFAFSYAALLVVLYILVAVPVIFSQYRLGPIMDHGEVVYSLAHIVGVSLMAFLLTLIPLFAIVSYGVLVSTAAKSLTSALGIGVGLLVAIEPLKHLIRWDNWKLSDYILTSYLDTALNIADKAALGVDYEWLPQGWLRSDLVWGLTLSLSGIVIFLGASYWIFLRRDLNFS